MAYFPEYFAPQASLANDCQKHFRELVRQGRAPIALTLLRDQAKSRYFPAGLFRARAA